MLSAENRLAPDSEQTGTVEDQSPDLNLGPCPYEAPDGWRAAISTYYTLLTPDGLPEVDPILDEDVATLLSIGLDFARAIIDDEPYLIGDAWIEARRHVARLAKEADERLKVRKLAEAREASKGKARAQRVYFIASEGGPIKIGIAKDPEARLRGLQTSHPERLSVLATCPGGPLKERLYHARFAGHRLSGEWFARAPEIEAEIDRLRKQA